MLTIKWVVNYRFAYRLQVEILKLRLVLFLARLHAQWMAACTLFNPSLKNVLGAKTADGQAQWTQFIFADTHKPE
jgi:hypothetical protein